MNNSEKKNDKNNEKVSEKKNTKNMQLYTIQLKTDLSGKKGMSRNILF